MVRILARQKGASVLLEDDQSVDLQGMALVVTTGMAIGEALLLSSRHDVR